MTTTEDRPSVVAVLRAVGKAGLTHLLPGEEARMLAGPVGRAQAGVPFTRDEENAAARLLQASRAILGPPLAHLGVTIPPPPVPVSPRPTQTGQKVAPVLWLADVQRIAVQAPFALRELMLGLPGREYGRTSRGSAWLFPKTPAAAAMVLAALELYGPRASPGVLALAVAHTTMLAARAGLDDDAPVPEYDGTGHVNMPLWTHQRRFVEFGEASQALCFAGKMGSGKTGAAIALANKVAAQRILIVCPNRVRRVWVREVRERSSVSWHIEDGTRPKLRGKGRMDLTHPDRVAQATQTLFDCDCGAPVHAFCVNYEALSLGIWQRWAPPEQLDLIVYDEAHKLKGFKLTTPRKVKGVSVEELRKRKARDLGKFTVSGLAAQWVPYARRRIALTGTPLAQHPWDIFGIYRALDPGIFGTVWTPFLKEYVDTDRTGTFPKEIKPEKMDSFATKVMSLMYRPTVDLKLPGFSDVLRTAELEPAARKIYDQLDTELWADLTAMLERRRRERLNLPEFIADEDLGSGAPVELTAANILSRLLRLHQLTGGTLRGDPVQGADGEPVPGPEVRVSRVKAEMLAEVLDEVGCIAPTASSTVDYEPEPVIVFCWFSPDLAAVREVAEKAGLRYGEISGKRGDGLDADARMAADRDVVGVQIQAGGTGIDLTRSRRAVFYSLPYSLVDYDQARARPCRPGQTDPVVFIHLQVEDTQDEHVYAALDARRDAIAVVLRAGGVEPDEVGVIERDFGPAPLVEMDLDEGAGAIRLPWE